MSPRTRHMCARSMQLVSCSATSLMISASSRSKSSRLISECCPRALRRQVSSASVAQVLRIFALAGPVAWSRAAHSITACKARPSCLNSTIRAMAARIFIASGVTLKAILGSSSYSKMPWLKHNWYRALAHTIALAPLIALAIGYPRDDLTANPIRFLTLPTGIVVLLLLVAALACTPINTLFGWRQAIVIRRALGLYAFTDVALYRLLNGVFDGGLDFELIWRDLLERRAMSVGLIAFLMLVPLAITSTNGWQRRLGKRWRMLHWLIYLAAPLSVLHFFWLDRDIKDAPIRYAAVVAALLVLRLRPVRRAIVQLRYRLVRPRARAAEPPQPSLLPPAVDVEDQA